MEKTEKSSGRALNALNCLAKEVLLSENVSKN